MSAPAVLSPAALAARLTDVGLADANRLGRRLERLCGRRPAADALAQLSVEVDRAEAKQQRRRGQVPPLSYPPGLPVSGRVDELAATISADQVVIVAGETGSGKSTQLPKICLQIGRGVRGLIGHTQPRRIAARALAERIAQETGTALGGPVGYSIRFGDHTGPDTLVKLMTDGILLAEIHRDPDLLAYDTIILDEAHERSLNIDFLLGYLKKLLPRRPDLKLIITSATIDPQRFAAHFGNAPVVEVSGRTFPVEIRYRPYGLRDDDGDEGAGGTETAAPARGAPPGRRAQPARNADRSADADQAQAITMAVDELGAAGDGDILVFLSGEREITDTAEVLRGHLAGRAAPVEILPLYGRLSAADQHRVFAAHPGRRIVLSTNVAETSLTVPGIRYVIDPGTARISRYSTRTKVQRLPIEPISQASAGQRAGRCGRVADGICIRLYAAEDFAGRPEFTDPEIARTSLASVILRMAALGLGDIADFPFLDPPDGRQISDGLTLLRELGALAPGRAAALTGIGRSMAALPIDPRLARIVLEGQARGCLDEMLVLTAALAIQDVREYPLDDRDRAAAAHARFVDRSSDFLGLLNLWRYLRAEGKNRSGNGFRRMCRAEYLHYLRIREWQDLHAQLKQVVAALPDSRRFGSRTERGSAPPAEPPPPGPPAGPSPAGQSPAGPATQQGRGSLADQEWDSRSIHTALLAGLLSHIGSRVEASRDYQGTRNTSFVLWPGSALAKTPPALAVAAELVETSRLFGRVVAAVAPEWVEEVGGDLLRRNYSEPRWSKRRAAAVATEKVTLLGVTLVAARTVNFGRIDPELSRELFLRHALVEGDWETRHAFVAANQETAQEVLAREDRLRRRGLLLDDQGFYDLYDARIPAEVTSGRHFDSWWRKASRITPDLLTFTADELTAAEVSVDEQAYPDALHSDGVDLDIDYVYEPGRADDGVTVTIPLAVLARVDPARLPGHIPGWRDELAVALIRSLPKQLRRNFVPAPDMAAAALAGLPPAPEHGFGPVQLAARLTELTQIPVKATDFDLNRLPDHLRLRFRVVDERGTEVATGKDLGGLQAGLRPATRDAVARVSGPIEATGLHDFPADGIAPRIDSVVAGYPVTGYPALVDEGTSVGVRVFTNTAEQAHAMRAGTRRLLARSVAPPTNQVRRSLSRQDLLTVSSTPYATVDALVADAVDAAVDALLDWAGGQAWTADAFAGLGAKLTPALPRAVLDVLAAAAGALRAATTAATAIDALAAAPAFATQVTQLRGQLSTLLRPGFITATGAAQLPDLARYLQALAIRAERVRESPDRDRARMAEVDRFATEIDHVIAGLPGERALDPRVAELRRMLQEYRVAVFAQPLRTAMPVSAKKLTAALAGLRS